MKPSLLALITTALTTHLTACSPPEVGSSEAAVAPLISPSLPPGAARSDLRIAVVGAGASGLTAALTLRDRGYANVTVFEKETRVGGKVSTFKLGSVSAELGAVFTSADYQLVLGLADRFQVPYVRYEGPRYILDEAGHKRTFQDFLRSRYSDAEIAGAVQSYARVLQAFARIDQDG